MFYSVGRDGWAVSESRRPPSPSPRKQQGQIGDLFGKLPEGAQANVGCIANEEPVTERQGTGPASSGLQVRILPGSPFASNPSIHRPRGMGIPSLATFDESPTRILEPAKVSKCAVHVSHLFNARGSDTHYSRVPLTPRCRKSPTSVRHRYSGRLRLVVPPRRRETGPVFGVDGRPAEFVPVHHLGTLHPRSAGLSGSSIEEPGRGPFAPPSGPAASERSRPA